MAADVVRRLREEPRVTVIGDGDSFIGIVRDLASRAGLEVNATMTDASGGRWVIERVNGGKGQPNLRECDAAVLQIAIGQSYQSASAAVNMPLERFVAQGLVARHALGYERRPVMYEATHAGYVAAEKSPLP